MRERAKLAPKRSRRRATVLTLLAAFMGGALLGLAIQPRFLLRGTQATTIPKGDSAEAQIFHAKMVDSEAAWEAVAKYFPDADDFLQRLAQQGLVRHYLIVTKHDEGYEKSLAILRHLNGQADQDESLEAFVLAAEYLCHERLGHNREAEEAYSQLTTPLRDQLAATDRQLFDLLEAAQSPQ
jgi:eukaryotic-like serine/threonine-protein kinase